MNIITILVIVKTIMVKQYAAGIVGTKSVFVENTKKYCGSNKQLQQQRRLPGGRPRSFQTHVDGKTVLRRS